MLIHRYLFKNVFLTALFVTGTLTCVIWLVLLLGQLQSFVDSAAPFDVLAEIILLTTPQFLEVVLPISLVAAILFTYNRLSMDNEIAVMRASGVGPRALARPALLISAIFAAVMMALTTWATPSCFYRMHALKHSLTTGYAKLFIREGVFSFFGDALTIYARKYSESGEVEGLTIYDMRDKKSPPVSIIARHAVIRMTGDTPVAELHDGVREQMDEKTGQVARLHFDSYNFEMQPSPVDQKTSWKTAAERTLPELLHPDGDARELREYHDAFVAEIHRRLVQPFSTITFAMISVFAMLWGQANRRGNVAKIAAAGLTVAALEMFDLSAANAAKKDLALVPLLYAAALLPLFPASLFLYARGEEWLLRMRRDYARWRWREAA